LYISPSAIFIKKATTLNVEKTREMKKRRETQNTQKRFERGTSALKGVKAL
jgi:hypothetical protein